MCHPVVCGLGHATQHPTTWDTPSVVMAVVYGLATGYVVLESGTLMATSNPVLHYLGMLLVDGILSSTDSSNP